MPLRLPHIGVGAADFQCFASRRARRTDAYPQESIHVRNHDGETPQARRHLFRGFCRGADVRAPLLPDRDADGQHAVFQHDAQSATAAHRPPFLRAGNRVGPAADELAVHPGADDRHVGVGHHHRHDHCKSRHERGALSPSGVRGRHAARHHRGRRQACLEVAHRRRHRRTDPPLLQPRRQARRRMPAQRLYSDAAGLMRSLLFVPADSPGKLAQALGCGADLDAVVPVHPDAIMLPKAEGGASVVHADAKLCPHEALNGLTEGAIRVVAIATETAPALFVAGTYRGASPRLAALTWGAEDLSTELGAEANRDAQGKFLDAYRLARTLCIAAAAAAKVPALDTVYVDFRHDAGLRRECEEARRDGFTGKMAIHPGQVATINDVFTPSPAAIARAQAIIAAFAATPGAGVVGIDGVMYDRPHLAKAERLLAHAGRWGRSVARME